MTTQVVRPAGAGHETLWVVLAAACVLAVAAILIGARAQPLAAAALSSHQIDARTQLNAAEQGVHADLLVAAEEITALIETDKALPAIEQLRGMDLPPFVTGVGAAARGAPRMAHPGARPRRGLCGPQRGTGCRGVFPVAPASQRRG
ncbi:DUF6162 family protein [Hydrogenophaga sp. UC242_53]|uniref:DUF6162 family protein n=1 Tax=Hydrogenophaga sp. UC242_53 TaxID=3350170 RepID=UPI0036D3DC59